MTTSTIDLAALRLTLIGLAAADLGDADTAEDADAEITAATLRGHSAGLLAAIDEIDKLTANAL